MRRPRISLRRNHDDDVIVARRAWSDRFVITCLAIGIIGIAFAAGRFSVDQGPQSVQEAMQLAQAGKLPFAPEGAATSGAQGSGGAPGMFGGGPPGEGATSRGGGAAGGSGGGAGASTPGARDQ